MDQDNKPGFLYAPQWTRVEENSAPPLAQGQHLIITHDASTPLVGDLKQVLTDKGCTVETTSKLNELPDGIGALYLFQGISPADRPETPRQSIERRELALFRSIKKLLDSNYRNHPLHITVLTSNTQKVFPDSQVTEAGAGIIGLIGSLAREQPHWHIRLIDLPATLPSGTEATAVLRCPFHQQGAVTAYRHEGFFQRRLYPLELTAKGASDKIRTEGVYVILGGAGGLGQVTTRHLIEKYDSQVIWLGRREENPGISAALQQMEQLGRRPVYIRCDATDKASLEAAYRKIKERFQSVHGIFHAAMVLRDRLLANMDEHDFMAAFAPKALATHYLLEVFAGEALDFACFYASVQSFWNAPGQGNYAAGCNYQDSLAHRVEHLPTYLINWGYWGEVGVVASEEYRERMALLGVGSISPDEGMQALQQLLAHEEPQLAALKIERRSKALDQPIHPTDRLQALDETTSLQLHQPDLPPLNPDKAAAFEPICAMSLLKTLKTMGLKTGGSTSADAMRQALGIEQKYMPLLRECLSTLSTLDHLQLDEQGRFVLSEAVEATLSGFVLDRELDTLLAQAPHLEAQARLLKRCLDAFDEILTGNVKATDVLFPHGSLEHLGSVYKSHAQADYYNELLARTVAQSIAANLQNQEKYRILEIGAGTGASSEKLFEHLEPYRQQLEYTYTDISNSFLLFAQTHFKPRVPYLITTPFDIERAPREQSLKTGYYDLVIGTNVVHATRDVATSLQHIKALLKKNGLLLLSELAQKSLFNTLTFGLLDGWWLAQDQHRRLQGSPVLPPRKWHEVLREVGFSQCEIFPQKGPQQIIAAQATGGSA